MSKAYYFILFVLVSFFFSSCEKELNIPLNVSVKSIVVQGSISTDEFPTVSLTKSLGFFEKIDLSQIEFVHNAEVKVTDLTINKSIKMREYIIDSTVNGVKYGFAIYAPDTLDPNLSYFIKGEFEHAYRLEIIAEGKIFTSVTKIPVNPGLDSLWLEPSPANPDSFRLLKAIYDDPDTIGNSIRYETLRQSVIKKGPENYQLAFSPNFDDETVNGTRFPFILDIGFDRNETDIDYQTVSQVRKGDTITVKWGAIDKPVYTFWNTLQFAQGSVGNPFSSPTQVQTNIYGGALGVWAGYGNYYKTIIDK